MPPADTHAAGIVAAPPRPDVDLSDSAQSQRSTMVLVTFARELYRDYGAPAYQAFVVRNPGGRVRQIEAAIVRSMGL